MRGRRRERAPRNTPSSLSAGEHAVLDAETIVSHAWIEQLLRYQGRMELSLAAVLETCHGAGERLAEEQSQGDPRRISVAHAELEHAIEVHRAIEAASRQAGEVLQAALCALAAPTYEHADSATASRARDRGPAPGATGAVAPGPVRRRALPRVGAPQAARRACELAGRLLTLARRARGREQSS